METCWIIFSGNHMLRILTTGDDYSAIFPVKSSFLWLLFTYTGIAILRVLFLQLGIYSKIALILLQVKTKLENPTSYHLKQQQQKQLKEYYNTQQRLSYGDQQVSDPSYLNTLTSPSSPDLAESSVASSDVSLKYSSPYVLILHVMLFFTIMMELPNFPDKSNPRSSCLFCSSCAHIWMKSSLVG